MKILLLNNAFFPDVVASAQHAGDLAAALAAAGHDVTVVSAQSGYSHPGQKFLPAETWRGVRVRRIRSLNLGKAARWRRAATFASFLIASFLRVVLMERHDVVVAMTSPPLISTVAALCVLLRGGSLRLWILDLNPDEAVAAGWLRWNSAARRFLDGSL